MKNINNYSKDELYQIFLDKIDDLSRIRLESIDMSLSIYKMKFTNLGCVLTETSCYNKKIKLKRNQLGFYADETVSLKNDEAFEDYNKSQKFLEEYDGDFKIINNLLKDKESILSGYYNTSIQYETDLEIIVKLLGYGSIREEELYESNPIHPSEEYKYIISLIERCKDEKNYAVIKEEVLNYLQNIFKDRYELKIKTKKEKYGYDFDPEYGVLIIDKEIGDMHMLYGVTDYNTFKDNYKKYDFINPDYLEMYLKIIVKCIK